MTHTSQQSTRFRVKTHTAGFQLSNALLDLLELEIQKAGIHALLMTAAQRTSADGQHPPENEDGDMSGDKGAGALKQESTISMITLNFRDPNYGSETGGFHPVEIAVAGNGKLLYVTDFSYVGSGDFAELARELDFDFGEQQFWQFGRPYPLRAGRPLFDLWQANFCSYYRMEVFTVEVTVS